MDTVSLSAFLLFRNSASRQINARLPNSQREVISARMTSPEHNNQDPAESSTVTLTSKTDYEVHKHNRRHRAQELCESRGSRPGPSRWPSLIVLMVSGAV